MASTQQEDSRRKGRLSKLFRDTLSGQRPVRNTQTAQLFLEAIRSRESASKCVEALVSSPAGLDAVRDAIRADLSPAFVSSHTLPFLGYLADPGVKTLVGGQLLRKVLLVVADPPTVLNALLDLLRAHKIPPDGQHAFAWLALELISLPADAGVDVSGLVGAVSERMQQLQKCEDHAAREVWYRVEKIIQIRGSAGAHGDADAAAIDGPGGRHDNDFADFRRISIYPTMDEFLSTQPPYYRTAREIRELAAEERPAAHLDNQFRLLREDMLAELREDLQVATGAKKGRRTLLVLHKLVPVGFGTGDNSGTGKFSTKKCTLSVCCHAGLEVLSAKGDEKARKKYLEDHPALLRHHAFGVFCRGKEIYGFASVDRNVDKLSQSPPVVSLQFTNEAGLGRVLLALRLPGHEDVQFVLVDTAVFAYEPVLLELQRMTDVPLLDALLDPVTILADPAPSLEIPETLSRFADKLGSELDIARHKDALVTLPAWPGDSGKKIKVDESQLSALYLALTSPVSVIQGPPGTGKSFIGAQAAKSFFKAGMRILVLSYTNHALDQFMEDLLDADIPSSSMVRIGSRAKCSPNTAPLLLWEQKAKYHHSTESRLLITNLRERAAELGEKLQDDLNKYLNLSTKWEDIAEYLEFADEELPFLDALRVPADSGGWERKGKRNKDVKPNYLYRRWIKGDGPGVFADELPEGAKAVWDLPANVREAHNDRWTRALLEERLDDIRVQHREYNDIQDKLDAQFSQKEAKVLQDRSILGCTTTAAAKYAPLIRTFEPSAVVVEEAGEILEAHILTALAPTVKQLVLIGDHKQLRPKINNYALSVEAGEGFDLNCSLFERLIEQGALYTTLCTQHRMAREISRFARELTYPHLRDGPNTADRPPIRGLRDRVVFVHHGRREDSDRQLRERREAGVKESKRNQFEAEMVLRCVKYLGQQGYGTDNMVVLTPYLGQVRALRDLFRKNNHDAALSDLDKAELLRAGLISEATALIVKTPLRISTIDNYQGEESDIVIASLTRSNERGDIGFMAAAERLNVLMTRARNGVVLIGNMDTFLRSKKGKATWRPFFDLLRAGGHLYDGLPVQCAKHPDRTALLRVPADFDALSPEGGCTEPCGALLNCGVHKCPSRCHRIDDHSRVECHMLVDRVCERQHRTRERCSRIQKAGGCHKCAEEDAETERRALRDLQLEERRRQLEREYNRQRQAIEDEIEHQRLVNRTLAEEEQRRESLEEARSVLASLKDTAAKLQAQKQVRAKLAARAAKKQKEKEGGKKSGGKAQKTNGDPRRWDQPSARAEWEFMKEREGVRSAPLDELMSMVGLEEVKQAFLSIKSRVDAAFRQGVSMADERFSCSMLGNPGTGKTTVARLYARFLMEFGLIPGSCFKEITGAGLAHQGVPGCKKLIEEMLNDGGGVLFIDEAYQLTSGNNPGGGGVLDYLLAEVENLRGKIVFVLAGYARQMEKFFAHNPGLPSRFPIEMKFADYTDDELLWILEREINRKYNNVMACEDGLRGLYCRIVARRVGRGRGKEGFGNARAVQNALAVIAGRQAERLRRERMGGKTPDDLLLTKEDLIGPEPRGALAKCEAWKSLQKLTGLGAVKEAVKSLVDSIHENYQRELAEQPLIEFSLNKVFLGNPGTGKTTVAKLYGEILVALGLLSKGEVVVKNPSDFIGPYIGHSEQQTKGILAATVGKVLVIDEAYGLYGGGGGGQGSVSDPYKTAVIDTLVAEVQSVPGDDRCVLLLGYREQMEQMFQNVNPGLQRRFPLSSAFQFDDFTDEELREIFDRKVKQQGYHVTDQAAKVAMEMLKRARNRPNFGNAGEIDIILNATKARHQARYSRGQARSATLLEARDFDEDFDRAERAETNVRSLFEGTVGSERVVALLEGYQETVRALRAMDIDPKPSIPFNFLFRGPPGTGKTTTARKMGKVYYDMGFLATAEVVECSTTDLIGQYVGQTGPKVQQVLDRALGRVLFIDEAYRLAEGQFAREAMDELVDSVTKERYARRLVIILAGYEADINRLMAVNSGLTSRFPEVIDFRALTADECLSLMAQLLRKQRDVLRSKGKDLDLGCLEQPSAAFKQATLARFAVLAAQESWASARDVESLARGVFNKALRDKEGLARGRLVVTESVVTDELEAMRQERASRSAAASEPYEVASSMNHLPIRSGVPSAPTTTTTTTPSTAQSQTPTEQEHGGEEEQEEEEKNQEKEEKKDDGPTIQRDAGVSDAVWSQLQRDRQAEAEREAEYERLQEAARRASEAARERIVRRLLEEEAARRREQEAREKLQRSGRCPVGYPWIRQAGGWRCAGGSHWVGEDEMGKL